MEGLLFCFCSSPPYLQEEIYDEEIRARRLEEKRMPEYKRACRKMGWLDDLSAMKKGNLGPVEEK